MDLQLTESFTTPAATIGNPVWWMLGSSIPLAWIVFLLLVAFLPRIIRDHPFAVVWYIGSVAAMLMLAISLTYAEKAPPYFISGAFLSGATTWYVIRFSTTGKRGDPFFKAGYALAWSCSFMANAFLMEAMFRNVGLPLEFASMLWWGVCFFLLLSLGHWTIGVTRLACYQLRQLIRRWKGKGQIIRITNKDWPQSR